MKVVYSEIESSVLGLRVGRCNENTCDPKTLFDELTVGKYDLCRLKVAAEDELAPLKLSKMGMPYAFSGSIRRYRTRITEPVSENYLHPGLEFIAYDGSQTELLRRLLIDTWGKYPLGYYRSPVAHSLITKEKELESVFQFYTKHNNPDHNANNGIMFMRDRGQFVGFFALNRVNTSLESHIGGILTDHRSSGYFHDMLRYIRLYCLDHGLSHFLFGARNENSLVQKAFESGGFSSVGSENVFHIMSMLTQAQRPPIVARISIPQKITLTKLRGWLLELLEDQSDSKTPLTSAFSFRAKSNDALSNVEKVVISFPLKSTDETLTVLKLFDKDDESISAVAYLSSSFNDVVPEK